MSKVSCRKVLTYSLTKKSKIIIEIFAQFKKYSYLCIIDARLRKASKICEQARENFL